MAAVDQYIAKAEVKMSGNTPTPVKAVQQYEADEALAKKLQQEYEDENKAEQMQEEVNLEDEFNAATDRLHQQESERYLRRVTGPEATTQ